MVCNRISSNLRIDEDVWENLRDIAYKNKRSINKEIEFILEKYVEIEKLKEKNNKLKYDKIKNI